MRPAAFLLLLTLVAAPLATPLPCVPDCCRGADGTGMAACPMNASNAGECQFRGWSPESGSTPTLIAHAAVLPPASAKTLLLPSGAQARPEARLTLSGLRDPQTPPPRG